MRINEIFGPVIQGEGPVIGWPTMFIRTQGCDSKCVWCDTQYALGPGGTEMSAEDIIKELTQLAPNCKNVTLTGGNPLIQDLEELVELLHAYDYMICIETQGTIYHKYVEKCDVVVVSPKPPSAGTACNQTLLRPFMDLEMVALKMVVFDDEDFAFAKDLHERYEQVPVYVQPGNLMETTSQIDLINKLRWLADKVLADPIMQDVVVLPQLHVLMYGNERGR